MGELSKEALADLGIDFDGPDYDPKADGARLSGQIQRVYEAMQDGTWRTLEELAVMVGGPVTSMSTRLRDLRKEKFGGHTVEKRPRGDRAKGLWEYRLVPRRLPEG